MSNSMENHILQWSDAYFLKTKKTIYRFGEARVTYAIFLRCPVISAPRLAISWLEKIAQERGIDIDIQVIHPEGRWVGAGEPLMYVSGPFSQLVDLETMLLMKVGPPCVAAQNAFTMCMDLPHVAFLAMDARHCAGTEMAELMAYAASVGSKRAQRKANAIGFIGNANQATAPYFNNTKGLGTMPHALIGYAESTVRAAEMMYETFPDDPLTVLVDYFAQEITDSLAVCQRFPTLVQQERLSLRLDTSGGRFIQGLDTSRSYAIIEKHVPEAIRGYLNESQHRYLLGTGVSAAAVHLLRDTLNNAGFEKVKIVASSGFSPAKCHIFKRAKAPVDVIGTGSYLPEQWSDTFAVADIIQYNGRQRVKVGREFLFPRIHIS